MYILVLKVLNWRTLIESLKSLESRTIDLFKQIGNTQRILKLSGHSVLLQLPGGS